MNLPRNERNNQSNVLLVGTIPGPSEPTNLNGFLAPLVKELNELCEGSLLSVAGRDTKTIVRCALLCGGFDLDKWNKHSRTDHLETVSKIDHCSTKKAVMEI